MDIASLLSLQGRSRQNALRAARTIGRERQDASEAQEAVAVAAAAVSPDSLSVERLARS